MRVAMLGWEFPPFIAGGLGVHCYHLTQELAKLGARVDFYMPFAAGANPDSAPWMRMLRVRGARPRGPYGEARGELPQKPGESFNAAVMRYNAALVAAFDSRDADVIHAHDWITFPAAVALHRATRKPLVVTVHSTEYDRCAEMFPQREVVGIERDGVTGATMVIGVSRRTVDQLVERYGARPERCRAVHNGVDTRRYEPLARRRDYSEEGLVTFMSRLTPQKGAHHFLHVAERVLERHDAQFAIGGTGPLFQELAREVVAKRIQDKVDLLGFVPDAEVPELYGKSAVYMLPSVSEPFGISVLEAAACGVPVVMSRTCGVAEAMPHALLADFWDVDLMAECVAALLDHASLRRTMGRAGARSAKALTWEACARSTLKVYEEALACS